MAAGARAPASAPSRAPAGEADLLPRANPGSAAGASSRPGRRWRREPADCPNAPGLQQLFAEREVGATAALASGLVEAVVPAEGVSQRPTLLD